VFAERKKRIPLKSYNAIWIKLLKKILIFKKNLNHVYKFVILNFAQQLIQVLNILFSALKIKIIVIYYTCSATDFKL